MSGNTGGNASDFPPAIATRAAGPNWSGYMQRWAAGTSTVASFAYSGTGTQRRLYVPPATASVAGALVATDKAKLDTLIRPVSRLNYVASTDVLNGAALTANTWTDIIANQSFTVGTANAFLIVTVRLSAIVLSTVGTHSDGARAVVDSAGTPLNVMLSGDVATVNNYGNVTGATFLLSTLAAGTHTIKLQVICSQNATASCHASSAPNFEFANIDVIEVSA